MKLFKWHLIDDIELRCYENGLVRDLKRRLDIAEKTSWERYLKIEKLENEIEKLNNNINELEKIVSLDFNYVNNDLSDNFVLGIRNEAKFIYRELQELKGADKE